MKARIFAALSILIVLTFFSCGSDGSSGATEYEHGQLVLEEAAYSSIISWTDTEYCPTYLSQDAESEVIHFAMEQNGNIYTYTIYIEPSARYVYPEGFWFRSLSQEQIENPDTINELESLSVWVVSKPSGITYHRLERLEIVSIFLDENEVQVFKIPTSLM